MKKFISTLILLFIGMYSVGITYASDSENSIESKYKIEIEARDINMTAQQQSKTYLESDKNLVGVIANVDALITRLKDNPKKLASLVPLIAQLESQYKRDKDITEVLIYLKSSVVLQLYILEDIISQAELDEIEKLLNGNYEDTAIQNEQDILKSEERNAADIGGESFDKGNYEEAIKYYNTALEIDLYGNRITYLYNIALSYYNLENYKDAISYFDMVGLIDSSYMSMQSLKESAIYFYNQDIDNGVLTKEITSDLVLEGIDLLEFQRYDEALDKFDEAIQNDEDVIHAVYYTALVSYYTYSYDDFYQISSLLDEIINIDPSYTDAYILQGTIYQRYNNWDKAYSVYDEAIKTDPYNAKLYLKRGYMNYANNDLYSSLKDYDIAESLFSSVNAFYYSGDSRSGIGLLREITQEVIQEQQ